MVEGYCERLHYSGPEGWEASQEICMMYHGTRTETVQSCQEAQTEQRTCQIHQHFHAVLSPI